MSIKNFLVTGANGDIGEAIGRILRDRFPQARLYGADATGVGAAYEVFDEIFTIPLGREDGYVQALHSIVEKLGPTLIIPVSEPELRTLAEARDDTEGLRLLMNLPEIILRFLDKLETATWLKCHEFPSPVTMPLSEATPGLVPLIVKPRFGSGSRNIEIVHTAARLEVVRDERKADEAIAQKLLEPQDAEFTNGIFRSGGEVRVIAMRRRLYGNMTAYLRVEANTEIERMLVRLADELQLEGVLNVQLILTDAGPVIFEINPRFSSTVMMRHKLGYSDLLWLIETLSDMPLSSYAPVENGMQVYRMSREVVMPSC